MDVIYLIFNIIGYAVPIIILGIIALILASKGKKYMGWLISGAIIDGVAIGGNYGRNGLTGEVVAHALGCIVIWLIFYIVANNTYNKHKR